MKTKIIYISGNEVFEMAQIRAAFDEVRKALGLDNNTILFGVPIDSDNALTVPEITAEAEKSVAETQIINSEEPTPQEPAAIIDEPVAPAVAEVVPEPVVVVDETVVDETMDAAEPESEKASADDEKVIPILSILSVKEEEIKAEEPADAPKANTIVDDDTQGGPIAAVIEDIADIEEPVAPATVETMAVEEPTDTAVISNINIDTTLVAPAETGNDDIDATPVTISDMIRDEAPVAPTKNTLEDLLESMKPLREDVMQNATVESEDDFLDEEWQQEDTDATLAQLASEFAENEDKIVDTPKETQGKIGKLKSILPFKKRSRDEMNPMDNLFGWAGVAANDEEFAIPGFFTPVTSKKKQGA